MVLALAPLVAVCNLQAEDFGFDIVRKPQQAAEIYCAREGFLFYFMRMPDGSLRRLERDLSRPGDLIGFRRWSGTVKGDVVTIRTDPKPKGGPAEFTFRRGRPVSVSYRGKTTPLTQGWRPPRYPDDESPLFDCMRDQPEAANSNPDAKWQDGRLAFPYENPNQSGLLYAGLGILSLGLLLVRRKWAVALGALLSGACLVLLLLTASRGGLLAYFFGAVPALAWRFRSVFSSRWFWPALTGLVIAAAVWMTTAPPRLVTRGSGEGRSGWSNRIRVELWRAAPRMMLDAPGGWKISDPGPAYVDWYQPAHKLAYTGSLMNDHLTRMAAYGWLGRFAYVMSWAALFVFCGIFFRRTGNGVPLGAWVALAVGAWFNPVTSGPWSFFVWLPALLASLPLVCRRGWLNRTLAAEGALAAAGLSLAVLAAVAALGSATDVRPTVKTEARRVTVNGTEPTTWIVDDGYALGGMLFGRDVREFYRANPSAPAVGYVKRTADLPAAGIRRLVLAGRAGDDYLREVCSDPSGLRPLPPEIVFLSPPFPPQAVPAPVLQSSRVRLYVGEFATWYSDAYARPPDWVRVVPGAARYLSDWMAIATGPGAGEEAR